jgi:hypothetical protein
MLTTDLLKKLSLNFICFLHNVIGEGFRLGLMINAILRVTFSEFD